MKPPEDTPREPAIPEILSALHAVVQINYPTVSEVETALIAAGIASPNHPNERSTR